MIVYNPRQWHGLVVLLSLQGSPLPQGAAFGLVSAAIAAAVKFAAPNELGLGEAAREDSLLDHPYATSIFASLVSFLVAFRANLAYSRFWEGRTQLQRMSTMWGDVGGMVIAFDENAKDLEDYDEWKKDFVHLLSLLHALAIMCLRCDASLNNLVEHKTYTSDKLGEGAWTAGEEVRLDRPVLAKSMAKGVTVRSGMAARQTYFNSPSPDPIREHNDGAAVPDGESDDGRSNGSIGSRTLQSVKRRVRRFSMPDKLDELPTPAQQGSHMVKPLTENDGSSDSDDDDAGANDAVPELTALPSRARALPAEQQASAALRRREVRRKSVDETEVPDMSALLGGSDEDDAEEGDGQSSSSSGGSGGRGGSGGSGGAKLKPKPGVGLARFKQAATTVVLTNKVLGALDPSTREAPVDDRVVKRQIIHAENPLGVIGGIIPSEMEALQGADTLHAERVYVACMWCQRAMVERYQKRGMRQGPPIVAQNYRSLSEGMNAFMQCKKIVDTPFPFPYAQCVMVALIMFMVSFPLQMCEVINDDFAAPVVSFFGVCVVVVVNRVATELEEPFMDDANDLPLADLHVDFNEKINKLVAPRFWRTRWSHKSADGDEYAPIIPVPQLEE